MPHTTNRTLLKTVALSSALLLLSGCLTQTKKAEEPSSEITSQVDTPKLLATAEEQHNIESVHYLSKQQGNEALRAPIEPFIQDQSEPQGQPPIQAEDSSLQQLSADVVEEQPAQAASPADLWHRLRQRYALPDSDHPGVKKDQNRYAKHPDYLLRVTERARPYLHFIVEEVEARGMPAEIALLPIVESAFLPFAYSHGRAAGIWQFIPSTGEYFGLKQNWWYDGRRDVYASTKAALSYLQKLHKTFGGAMHYRIVITPA